MLLGSAEHIAPGIQVCVVISQSYRRARDKAFITSIQVCVSFLVLLYSARQCLQDQVRYQAHKNGQHQCQSLAAANLKPAAASCSWAPTKFPYATNKSA